MDNLENRTAIDDQPSSKWGELANAGFQILPDIILKQQKALGLNSADMVVLINLSSYWWYAEKRPFTRAKTIADRMGTDVRTVQRSLKKLQNLGLIEKKNVSHSEYGEQKVFDLQGLITKLIPYALKDPGYRQRIKPPKKKEKHSNVPF